MKNTIISKYWYWILIVFLLFMVANVTTNLRTVAKYFLGYENVALPKISFTLFVISVILLLIILLRFRKIIMNDLKFLWKSTNNLPFGLRISLPIIILAQLFVYL